MNYFSRSLLCISVVLCSADPSKIIVSLSSRRVADLCLYFHDFWINVLTWTSMCCLGIVAAENCPSVGATQVINNDDLVYFL